MNFSLFQGNMLGNFLIPDWKDAVMIFLGLVLIYLAIVKEYEPVLLLPIGFGCILANLGMAATADGHGFLSVLYRAGIESELFPLLIFIGVGGMIDFSPLLSQPYLALLGAAGQFGIYGTLIIATLLGFDLNEAASLGVIGAIDGPTAIFVAGKLAPEHAGAYRRGCLFLYESDPYHPATCHETPHYKERTFDPHGIRSQGGQQKSADHFPDHGNRHHQHSRARCRTVDCRLNVGQLIERIRCG